MNQDQESRRNQDGEGRGPTAFSVVIWIALTSLCVVLGFYAVSHWLQIEIKPEDLRTLVVTQGAQAKSGDATAEQAFVDVVRDETKPPRKFRYKNLKNLVVGETSVVGNVDVVELKSKDGDKTWYE